MAVPSEPMDVAYRWVVAALDILYLFLMSGQKKSGQFPSKRFDRHRGAIITHLVAGCILIYSGVYLHIHNQISPINNGGNRYLYLVMAVSGVLHSLTVVYTSTKVMGELRITFPLYMSAGIINLVNSVFLILHQDLRHAFLLWGSVNTFIFVRVNILLLMMADIDWELAYTYSIIAAASTSYPLSHQGYWVYALLATPLLYAPFHERVCRIFGLETEDSLGGNKPAKKNINSSTLTIRRKLSLTSIESNGNQEINEDDQVVSHAPQDSGEEEAAASSVPEAPIDRRAQFATSKRQQTFFIKKGAKAFAAYAEHV